jgi:molecular chaperone HtpG
MKEKGTISIHTENIFPIIKKFLYSDNEIFLRELVSNAADANQKIKRLSGLGQYNGELGELAVNVSFDKDKKTITISDNGLGMTAKLLSQERQSLLRNLKTLKMPMRLSVNLV